MFAEKFYNFAPIWIQNLFCSLYGLNLYQERYFPPWRQYYDSLLHSERYDKIKITNLQKRLLVKLLVSAKKNTEYYKDILPEIPSHDNFLLPDFIKSLPLLEKDTFRANPDFFLSAKYDKKHLVKIGTSGTTGTPMSIYITPNARKMNYAFFARSKKWAGIGRFERSVTFAGRLIVPQAQQYPPFWRSNFFFRNNLFSSYHISDETIPFYVEAMIRMQPYFIDSYPSSIYPIAKYIVDNGNIDIRTNAIITSSETLFEHQRQLIEKAFGCKVFDQYGSAEQVVFACQCEYGSYHLNPEFGYLEVVDNNNEPVSPGDIGEFVCTGFTNDAMPLIRYKIGDMGALSGEVCPCGSYFPIIKEIIGRIDDILITPEGKYIGRLDPIFKGMSNSIKESQIVQQSADLIHILIVKSDGYVEKDGISVVNELRKRVGERMTIKVEYVMKIPRSAGGKYRSVLNNMQK